MSYKERLLNNKGTVSSKLSKEIANEIITELSSVPIEIIELCLYEKENPTIRQIRSGAAKIVEIISEQKPTYLLNYLKFLSQGIYLSEAQTRWMIIKTFANLMKLNPKDALLIKDEVISIYSRKIGLVMTSSCLHYFMELIQIDNKFVKGINDIIYRKKEEYVENEFDFLVKYAEMAMSIMKKEEKDKMFDFICRLPKSRRKITLKRFEKFRSEYGTC